ncbi:UDP-forming cellulose synthase catalytic subunit [Undibacterium sp. CY7W]|uniref:Cellulose synthase catalytic subunit [UDP-forming] n=2 Tax=Undibacterium TaxID=401469 RepID=A0A923KTW3_9BURK|nr:UDP-forming cellulose synthase catalytic subunit [Undibacterium rugosum]MBC3936469.1 UDP-forming cellulose synthase catalytic subunit [Undibacterium rugosum]
MRSILNSRYMYGRLNEFGRSMVNWQGWEAKGPRIVALIFAALLYWTAISVPMDLPLQTLFSTVVFLAAMYLRRYTGTLILLIMVMFSVSATSRYIYWRIAYTIDTENLIDLFFALVLIMAEVYAWLVLLLGYLQTAWPLKRKPVILPADTSSWPTVDLFIPSYNEDLSVVKPTVMAAMGIDWPKDKLNIIILDDGRRPEFAEFAASIGVQCFTRADNNHAKAGNINAALKRTNGEFVAIFDCDHMPTRSFLQYTMGWFLVDPKLAMVQTPHHFLSPDPFERNLQTFRNVPNEGELFYGLIQDGNDLWNATFFCGSCAILRRTCLEEVGGIAVETVTEDAHTALKMQRLGYNTAYLALPQAAGLATESLSAHVGQRIRWARGMAQIFRVDNPLLGKGLSFGQRLCYSNAMLHFFYGLPRMVFLLAPISYLFFEVHIIKASALTIAAYSLPHLLHANLTNSRIQGAHRHSFWAEVYEATLAWYIFRPTLVALINPKLGKFNVTAKGGLVEKEHFDWVISKPYLVMLGLNVLGFLIGIGRALWWNTYELDTVILNMLWTIYNLVILGATLAVATETKQVRRTHRVRAVLNAGLRLPTGHSLVCQTEDFSMGGMSFRVPDGFLMEKEASLMVSLYGTNGEAVFPAKVIFSKKGLLSVQFLELDMKQQMELISCTIGRADVWLNWSNERDMDHPLNGLKEIAMHSVSGFIRFGASIRQYLSKDTSDMDTSTINATNNEKRSKMKMPWKRTAKSTLAIAIALGLSFSVAEDAAAKSKKSKMAEAATEEIEKPATEPTTPQAASGQKVYNISLKQMGQDSGVELRGVEGERSFPFTVRSDEVITSAKVRYGIAYSPALLPDLSHIKVLVNNELVSVVPLPKETSKGIVREDNIDPRYFADFNQLSFRLIGHYTRDCEDPFHSSLWARLSNTTYLELTVSSIELANDLALLPAPFFDRRDSKLLELPFVLPASPSLDVLKNAGTVASWFGHLASYRGSRFPIAANGLPKGNAIVFATAKEAPAGLQLPAINGPTLMVVPNPVSPKAKLLLVMGRDSAELKTAVQALTLGQIAMSGPSAVIKNLKEPNPRLAYDAPKWLPTHRPVKFGELVPNESLQVSGLTPDLIRVNMRVAPDLFTWQKEGVPIDLRYRFTPRPTVDKSTLNIGINENFVRALSLSGAEIEKGKIKESVMLFFKDGHRFAQEEVQLPIFRIGAENQLKFHFFYDYPKQGACKDVYLDNVRSAIDPDSTIDFSHMPHYATFPNLAYLANAGFPYTRFADLSETAIIMPDRSTIPEMEVFLNLMGRMGESTGYPVTNATLIRGADVDKHSNKELLVIATAGNQPLLKQWAKYMPFAMDETGNRLQLPTGFLRVLARWTGKDLDDIERRSGEMLAATGNNFGALMQFQSPLSGGRNVIVLTAGDGPSLLDLTEGLNKSDIRSKYQGDLVLLKGERVASFLIGDTYYAGNLPLWTWIKWTLSGQPVLLILFLMLASLIAATLLFRFLKRKAATRLRDVDGSDE